MATNDNGGREMKVTEAWLDLKVNRYEDGNYTAYEELSGDRFETSSWPVMCQWLSDLIEGIGELVELTEEARNDQATE